ncbi:MAG: GntG family PLP-dependent aldolase [Myxococcota bacterium]
MIDLRSDTVTKPTEAMWTAMRNAELGDDVLGDDPTVQRLEARAAERAGKEAALFVPSGTMANLLGIEVHTRKGDEVLMHEGAHPFHYESGNVAAVAGVQIRLMPGERGILDPATVIAHIRPDAPHFPPATLLCLEDTHNRGGGVVQPLETLDALCATAREHGLAVHLDGARLWHAVVASGIPMARRVRDVDTVSFCFSKGLGCPVGSVVCGTKDCIQRARRIRKALGGAMRQSGLLAAAALYAMEHHVERLADDHARAKAIAEGLAALGLGGRPPETNLLVVEVAEALKVAEKLADHGVRCFAIGPDRLRLVVHLEVTDDDVPRVIGAFERALA